jgi:two-component system response regulator NreC
MVRLCSGEAQVINAFIVCGKEEERELISASLRAHNDFCIAGLAEDGFEALTSINLKPDIIILDIKLSDTDGPELVPILKRRSPSTVFMVMSSRDDDALVRRAINAGISAYLLKESDMEILPYLARIVFRGGYYFSASIITRILKIFSAPDALLKSKKNLADLREKYCIQDFSSTERMIIIFLARGYSDKKIAKELNITEGTVRNCVVAIRRKTGLRSRIQIVLYALLHGFITFDQINMN